MRGHVVSARRRGLTDTDLDALEEPASWDRIFDERTVAVLRLADAMCGPAAPLEPQLISVLRHHFTEDELAELVLVCGQANLNNRVANAAKQLLGSQSEIVGRNEFWNTVYRQRRSDELGWYEPVPSTFRFVIEHAGREESVVDVGGGDSHLVESLIDFGYRDLAVLDISDVAIERMRGRLGTRADDVSWFTTDVTTFQPSRTWDVWHDRAVFHFLIDERDRQAYKVTLLRALAPAGRVVIATFAPDGPETCSGLPVTRYDESTLAAFFGPELELVLAERVVASHDVGDRRPYVVALLRRTESV